MREHSSRRSGTAGGFLEAVAQSVSGLRHGSRKNSANVPKCRESGTRRPTRGRDSQVVRVSSREPGRRARSAALVCSISRWRGVPPTRQHAGVTRRRFSIWGDETMKRGTVKGSRPTVFAAVLLLALVTATTACTAHVGAHRHGHHAHRHGVEVKVAKGHTHSHRCGHYRHRGKWYLAKGHVHGDRCGHVKAGGVWVVRTR